jgi:hypothetical protein
VGDRRCHITNERPSIAGSKAVLGQDVEKASLLTRPTPADVSYPPHPPIASQSMSRDAPFSELCSLIAQRLNVPNKSTIRLFARCGRAREIARFGAPGLGG